MIALITGILCSSYQRLPNYLFVVPGIAAIICYKISRLSTDLLLLLTFIGIGIQISIPPISTYPSQAVYLISGRCTEELPHHNYILSAFNQKFYLNHFYLDTNYRPGDSLTFHASILPLQYNTNPAEFSYANYLKQKNVYHQLHPYTKIQLSGHSDDLFSFFNRLRDKLLKKTNRLIRDTTYRMLINALCLGYKNDMDSDFQKLFTATGTVHLLSVSGLHTGAIFLLFLFIFKHLGLNGKTTRLGILPLLWAYACLTGLSPSVVRASTILTFISIGQAFCRTYNPVNSLAASAFFTLSIHPSTLYSLSFLLSYSAYSGILLIYPVLFRLPGKLPKLLSKIYACFCVTLAAQIPTLPISAFCFHTININGFIANLIAVPLATLLLYSSTICLILPVIFSKFLIFIPEFLCRILVTFLQVFKPYSINLNNVYPLPGTIMLIYASMITLGAYILQRKQHWLWVTAGFLSILLIYGVTVNQTISSRHEIMIFHYYHQSAILLNHEGYYLYLKNTLRDSGTSLPYIQQNKLKPISFTSGLLGKNLLWNNHSFHWKQEIVSIPEQGTYPIPICQTLIVTNNLSPSQVFPSGTIQQFPQVIVIDGSNNKFIAQQWYKFCNKHNIILQNTSEKGAVCLPLK